MPYNNIPYRKYILLFLCIWMIINLFPGSYNVDTWYQYFEMEKNDYDDWHSPWMACLWRVFHVTTDRFFAMYLFQMAWYFIFYYYLLRPITNKWLLSAGLASSVFLIFIPQYIMKDLHIALAWGSAVLILLYAGERQPRYARYLALLFMLYGLYIRPNTLPALFPLLYIYVETYAPKQLTVLRKTGLSLLLSALFLGSYYIATYKLLQVRRAYPEYKLKLMDVIGISKLSGENYMPGCITSFDNYDHENILSLYSPATIDHIYWPGDNVLLLPMPTETLNQSLTAAWKKAIIEHPYLYIKNRVEGFLYYLKIWRRVQPDEYWNATVSVVTNNYIPIDDHHTPFTKKMLGLWNEIDKLHFYDPWLWLLLNIILFVVFLMRYKRSKIYLYKTLSFLQLSGILFIMGMLPVFQIDRDFRYTYWNVFVFLIGIVYFFSRAGTAPVDNKT